MKVYCKVCNNATNHESLFEHKDRWDTEDISGGDSWFIIRCMGCNDISFKHSSWCSEDWDPRTNEVDKKIEIYPIRGEYILTSKDFYSLSSTIQTIYKETIDCFNNQCLMLCAIGIRAILEGICKEEEIKSGTVINSIGKTRISKNLDGKIAGLKEKGILTKKHSDFLHELRFLGNEAAHELSRPSSKELKIAIEIIEHTIENLYELEDKVKDLKFASRKRKRII
ncbi:MAG: hypothetical protein JWQ79_679 [Mucilaginibacter sp.]|nr:hypothetical protein [Mucilaginibacter sp.]